MNSKIEEMIQAERTMIEKQLNEAIARREAANDDVKELREKLDRAPRLHVKRTRKSPGSKLADDVVGEPVTLPSALEMFPVGVVHERGE